MARGEGRYMKRSQFGRMLLRTPPGQADRAGQPCAMQGWLAATQARPYYTGALPPWQAWQAVQRRVWLPPAAQEQAVLGEGLSNGIGRRTGGQHRLRGPASPAAPTQWP